MSSSICLHKPEDMYRKGEECRLSSIPYWQSEVLNNHADYLPEDIRAFMLGWAGFKKECLELEPYKKQEILNSYLIKEWKYKEITE